MTQHTSRQLRAMLLAGAAGLAICAPSAIAQDDDADAGETDTITVTGSFIPRQDLAGPSPVTIVDQASIQQSGAVSIGQFLRELPSVAGQAQTTSINNGGGGSQEVSLRGLGSERTLVLLNGRRLPDSSAGLAGQVDLSSIPVSLIERVEVLKDGASTTYGADAIAGVVNVILREDFDGFEASFQTGTSAEGDGDRQDYSVTYGKAFEGGNFFVNLSKTEQDAILAGDREFSATAFNLLFGDIIPGGSSAPPWGRYFVEGAGASSVTLGPDFTGGDFFGFRDYSGVTDPYNFAPINFQSQPVDRFSLTFVGNLDVDPLTNNGPFVSTRAFTEISYSDRENSQQLAEVPLAPFAFFGFDAPYSADNAFNPFGQDITDWRRRLVESGGRRDFITNDTLRIVGGLEGEFAGGWDWELSYSYGNVDNTSSFSPIINLNNTALAVGPTAFDDTGAIRCDTDGDGVFSDADDGDCVPLNVFGENSITPEMLDYISITQNESTEATSEIYSFTVVKEDLFTLPAGPVGFAAGYVRREEQGSFTPDSQVAALGDAATGTPSQSTNGGYELDEFFAETRIPLLAESPLGYALDVEAGIRFSDYDTFGDTTNYKLGVTYRPVQDILLRGSFNTSFRAPQIDDLFGGASNSFPSVTDPCAANPTPTCIADGVPAGGFEQISSQVRTIVGGRESLQPEEAETFTFGGVFTPSQLEGFAVGADYFSYDITDAITTVGAGVILRGCATTGAFCDQITRVTTPGATQGAPILVDDRTTNVGGVEAIGVDIFAEYSGVEVGPVTFDFKWDATYYDTYDVTQADGSVFPHAGFFRDDIDGHFAEWRWQLGVVASIANFTASAQYRFIDEVQEFDTDLVGSCVDTDGNVALPAVAPGLTCIDASSQFADINLGDFGRTMEGAEYLDVYLDYTFNLLDAADTTVFFGVDNVTDEQPPFSIDGFNDNTDVRTFDTVGRYFYGGFRARF